MKKDELKISHTVYPDKEYSFNEITENIKSELKYTNEQKRTLAILDGYIDAHKELEIYSTDSQMKKEEMKVVQTLTRLKEALEKSYKNGIN